MRSLLAVPANNARFVAKAAQSAADAVFLDLEDAVVPEFKDAARHDAIAAIRETDWGERTVAVRVNDLATPWVERDVLDIARACKRLDAVILPKCESSGDVRAVDSMLAAARRERPVRLYALVETALGVANAESIAATEGALAGLIFGPGDYTLDMGGLEGSIDTTFALARVGNAARAFGLDPIDGPYFDIANPDGCRAAAKRAASLGFGGKMAIHPSQVGIANEVFSPSAAQLAWAREVLDAMEAAGAEGRGAVKTREGKMIDLVHIRIARRLLERAPATPQGGVPR